MCNNVDFCAQLTCSMERFVTSATAVCQFQNYRSRPEMVGDMSRVTLNFDLSKIPFVRFYFLDRVKTYTHIEN